MNSGIPKRPNYVLHKEWTGAPVADDNPAYQLDPADAQNNHWCKIHCFVVLEGGTSPTVSIEQLTVAKWDDGSSAQESLIGVGGLQNLTSGQQFTLNTNGAPFLVRLDSVNGDPTKVQIHVAGDPCQS